MSSEKKEYTTQKEVDFFDYLTIFGVFVLVSSNVGLAGAALNMEVVALAIILGLFLIALKYLLTLGNETYVFTKSGVTIEHVGLFEDGRGEEIEQIPYAEMTKVLFDNKKRTVLIETDDYDRLIYPSDFVTVKEVLIYNAG